MRKEDQMSDTAGAFGDKGWVKRELERIKQSLKEKKKKRDKERYEGEHFDSGY
jgi:hypothetical protein